MKNVIIFIVVLLFIGCGGGSATKKGGKSGDDLGKQEYGDAAFKMDDYLFPKSSGDIVAYKYERGVLYQKDRLTYTVSSNLVKERSNINLGGSIDFLYPQDGKDGITVTIYKDSKPQSFTMRNYIDINDSVTFADGECRLSAHYDRLDLFGRSFNDLLEITCPNSVGYYQRSKGLVVENIINDLESNNIDELPDFKDREIVDVDKSDSKFGNLNLESAKIAQVDFLWEEPYNLNGEGIKIGLVDGGNVRSTHVELRGRVHNLSNSDLNKHATHTAGTLISSGTHLYESRGFAKDAELFVLDYHDIYFAKAVRELLDYGVLISNHSYGFNGAEGLGEYDRDSKEFDELIASNPYIIAVVAAGNDGRRYKRDSDFSKWGLIKGGANAKNVITVAAVDDDTRKVADFSSRGPIKGGRLKPDIALDGMNILSTVVGHDDDSYGRLYGTSMAAPAVTGTIALLSQRYKQINSSFPRVDTIKAILFNSAIDIENLGPDFKSGFGQLDALAATHLIDSMESENSLIKLETIHQNEHLQYRFRSDRYGEFKATVAWVDNGIEEDKLVNDLDIYLEDVQTKRKIYPFTLDEFNPNRLARRDRPNHIDPQEQIVARVIEGREYVLHILGAKIPSVKDFTLVSNILLSNATTNMKVVPMKEQVHEIYESINR